MSTDLLHARDMLQQCHCLQAQRSARQLARAYDAALRPVQLTSGQFSLLAALNQGEPVPLGRVADALGLERTTLTRNLRPLEDAGWIESSPSPEDARIRLLSLSQAGRDKLRAAMPLWRQAQAAARQGQ